MSEGKRAQVDFASTISKGGGSWQEIAEFALRDELATVKAERDQLRAELKQFAHVQASESEVQQPKQPRSLTPFIARQWIALRDAAQLLAESNEGDCAQWADTLMDAADSRMIDASNWSSDPGTCPLRHEHIRAWCESHGYAWPIPLPEGRQPEAGNDDGELRAELDRAWARIAELESERSELLKKIEATAATVEATGIKSPTLQRIIEAVGHYPAWRATKPQEPNLKSVLDWQENQQREKGNGSRVAHVAHHVIAEHFGLKS